MDVSVGDRSCVCKNTVVNETERRESITQYQ